MTGLPTTNASRPRVVIVGAGFGGLAAARGLAGVPVDVTIIDRTNHNLFQPLLYQVGTAALAPSDIAVPIEACSPTGRRSRSIWTRLRPSTRTPRW